MKNLLLTVSAVAAIAAPALSMAQPNPPTIVRQEHNEAVRHDVRQDVRQDVRYDANHMHVWSAGDHSWWRGRPEFAGYAGVRTGFWFVPGRGYIRPDARWYGFAWRVGGFVPAELRGYYVADPFVYGLTPVGPAFRYVYLGNSIALMNVYNGRIVRVYPNTYF